MRGLNILPLSKKARLGLDLKLLFDIRLAQNFVDEKVKLVDRVNYFVDSVMFLIFSKNSIRGCIY